MDNWTSILESNPNANGTYYVYVMNCMDNSSDILKLRFENGEWQEFGDEYDRLIVWKNLSKKILSGEIKEPTISTVIAIADALEINIEEIVIRNN